MGLGKTLTIIAFYLHRSAGPTIVVCPASLLTNWEREIARFAPGIPVRRHHGAARDLNGLPAGVPGPLIERSVAVAERRQSDAGDCPSFRFRPRQGGAR
jgi:SNF2 family DNA or RNA helicase